MKRPAASPAGKKGQWSCADEVVAKKFPQIAQMMCDGWWEDGKVRELATLSINFSQGSPTISLNDHACARSCFTTGETILEALQLLESALDDETVRWRAWKAGKGH